MLEIVCWIIIGIIGTNTDHSGVQTKVFRVDVRIRRGNNLVEIMACGTKHMVSGLENDNYYKNDIYLLASFVPTMYAYLEPFPL